jgi:hypothetical protein
MAKDANDFSDFSLIGFVLSTEILAKLVDRGAISVADAEDVLDGALLSLESWQGLSPAHRQSFERARDFLSRSLASYRSIPRR